MELIHIGKIFSEKIFNQNKVIGEAGTSLSEIVEAPLRAFDNSSSNLQLVSNI